MKTEKGWGHLEFMVRILLRVTWTRWSQAMECHWRVLGKEAAWSGSLFRNVILTVMHIFCLEEEIKKKE